MFTKKDYDNLLKEIYIKEELEKRNKDVSNEFRSGRYSNYFKDEFLDKNGRFYIDLNNYQNAYSSYLKGGGEELISKRVSPPKFLSIGSSSNFCFYSLRNKNYLDKLGFNYFLKGGDKLINNSNTYEKALKIKEVNKTSYIDAFMEGEKELYFFECKCHEYFDKHVFDLSLTYGKKDLIKELKIDQCSSDQKGINFNINPYTYFELDKLYKDKGSNVKQKTYFYIKQLLTHLMAITDYKSSKKKNLIYFYSFPPLKYILNNLVLKSHLVNVVKETYHIFNYLETKIDYLKKNNIELSLFIKIDGRSEESACSNNVINGYRFLELMK